MRKSLLVTLTIVGFVALSTTLLQCKTTKTDTRNHPDMSGDPNDFNDAIEKNMKQMFDKGKAVFRFETFGDEAFWTDQLQLNKVIADEKHGGTGKGLTPKQALDAGLKVDLAVLPRALRRKIRQGKLLDDPWLTLKLLKINAVLGVVGKF